jgi:hypothetical protein
VTPLPASTGTRRTFLGTVAARWHDWVGNVPWPFPALLVLAHAGIVGVYVTGTAVSDVPFRSDNVRTIITSPITPLAHLVCAGLLCAGLAWRGTWRDLAGAASAPVWVGYTVILFVSARTRVPPLGLGGAVLSAVVAALAFLVAVGWKGDESAEDG